MNKLNEWIKEEFIRGYSFFERAFMLGMILVQVIVFIISPDSILAIVSGISGIISVVLCAKGKISFYFIGFVQTITYIFLAWENRFYGEVLENIFYLITMVWGIFLWKKNLYVDKSGASYVSVKSFNLKQWGFSVLITGLFTLAIGYVLSEINNQQAYTDAATNVLAIFGQILMIKRYKEQWVWWLAVDILCIKMWIVAGNNTMVVMYVAWTLNCLYGWYNWNKLNSSKSLKKGS